MVIRIGGLVNVCKCKKVFGIYWEYLLLDLEYSICYKLKYLRNLVILKLIIFIF